MRTKQRKTRGPRLPRVHWKEIESTPAGNQQWQSRDGMLRLLHRTQYDGIPVAPLYELFVLRRGHFRPTADARSRARIEKMARAIAAELEADDE